MPQDDIAKNLSIETLIAATEVGTADDTWIDAGSPIRMSMDNRLILYYDLVINDSLGVQIRFVPCKTETGSPYAAFNAAMDTWTLNNVDENRWIEFDAEAFLWVQVQMKATTINKNAPAAGDTATLALDFSRVRV